MRHKMKLIILVVLIVAMTVTGCGLFSMSEEKDRQQVIAEVNGEPILKGEMLDQYFDQKIQYGITEEMEADPELKDAIFDLKLGIIDSLVFERAIKQKATEAGFIINDELLAEANMEFQVLINEIAQDMMKDDEQMGSDTEGKDYSALAREYIDDQLDAMGWTKEKYLGFVAQQLVIERFVQSLLEDMQSSEDDIRDYYDTKLSEQKDDSKAGAGDVVLYEPDQVRVKYITVELPDERIEQYDILISEDKDEEAEEYLNKSLEMIVSEAEDILSKAKNGEDFDELIATYTPDIWVGEYKDGIFLSQNGDFLEEIEDAAFGLGEGELSGLVDTPYGYFIVKVYEKKDDKTYTYDEKRNEIKELLDNQLKGLERDKLFELWMEEAVINIYEDKI